MLTAGGALASDLGDAIERDPEVRQARTIAEAARTRLMACVSRPEDRIDLAEAQRMLNALRDARTLVADAEDRVLVHRGLLAPAEADRRAATRRPAIPRGSGPTGLPGAVPRLGGPGPARLAATVLLSVLALVLAALAGAALARRFGVRQPPEPR